MTRHVLFEPVKTLNYGPEHWSLGGLIGVPKSPISNIIALLTDYFTNC